MSQSNTKKIENYLQISEYYFNPQIHKTFIVLMLQTGDIESTQ